MNNYCTNCGTKLDENKKCPNCKNILTSVSVKEEKKAKKSATTTAILFLSTLILYLQFYLLPIYILKIICPIFLIATCISLFYTLVKFKNVKTGSFFLKFIKIVLIIIVIHILLGLILMPLCDTACTDFCSAME